VSGTTGRLRSIGRPTTKKRRTKKMKTNDVALSIINLANGAACEQFDYELGRVIRNIADPNTPAKKVREVMLKVKITPDENRMIGAMKVTVDSKLASQQTLLTALVMGIENGKPVAREMVPDQQPLFSMNVVPIKKEEVSND